MTSLNGSGIFDFKLYPPEAGIIKYAIQNKEVGYYVSLKEFIKENIKDANEEKIEEIVKNNTVNTIIIIPIIVKNQFYGFLSVFSPRKELKDDELSFLNLFSRQISLLNHLK